MVSKKVYVDDFGFNLNFTLTDGDGNAIDLTLATSVAFKMMKKNGTVANVSGTCTINSPTTDGTCFYTVVDGDLDKTGEFQYQIQITTASSVTTCEAQETITVLRKL